MFGRNKKNREVKKIFQWEQYLNWKEMTYQQRINFKRALLFPFLLYFVYSFLSNFAYAILIIFSIYYLIRFKDRNKLYK